MIGRRSTPINADANKRFPFIGVHQRSSAALATVLLAACVALAAAPRDVRQYGAKGDGAAKDTRAIQAAIDAAAAEGGGTVEFPPGRYLAGTIHLRNNVSLHIPAGATLAESPDNADFDPYEQLPYKIWDDRETTYFHYALLAGENVHDIAIYGQGTIDGNRPKRGGPKPIALKLCQRISIRGLTFRDAPNYTISFLGSDYIDIEGVTILNGYADGIDPDSSRHVRIANTYIDAWDDTICPKASHALGYRRSVEDLTVTNCILTTNSNHFKFGTESGGDFKNIAFTNSACYHRPVAEQRHLSGVAIESADGSNIDGVVISNIVMQDVFNPIFIHLGARGRGDDEKKPGTLKNVSISNIVAVNSRMPSSVTGIPGHPVERVSLDNIQITMVGGEQNPRGIDIPDLPAKGPESDMFGPLPAYGFYARHVDGLSLRNIRVRWRDRDLRSAMLFDDVRGLDIDGFHTDTVAGSLPVLWFHNVMDALVRGARPPAGTDTFLRVTGDASRDIRLLENDLTRARRDVEYR